MRLVRETPCGHIDIDVPDWVGSHYREQIADGKLYEPATVETITEALEPGAVFYDIGARWGYFSAIASKCGAEVFAFEQDSDTFKRLLDNVAPAPGIGLYNTKVTADDGIPPELPAPTVAKIDVEGDELWVLRLLADQHQLPDVFAIEMHPSYLAAREQSVTEVVELLDTHGYDVEYAADHRFPGYEWDDDFDTAPSGVVDYLLTAER